VIFFTNVGIFTELIFENTLKVRPNDSNIIWEIYLLNAEM
jgi:hypothetical protein